MIRTVVNKVNNLKSQFRTLDFELLAGDADYDATVNENGLRIKVLYDKVYWNSRLSAERERVVGLVPHSSLVIDVMAGVGGFGLYLAVRNKCSVWANDINPNAAELIKYNANQNKVDSHVTTFNMDGRAFIKHVLLALRMSGTDVDSGEDHTGVNANNSNTGDNNFTVKVCEPRGVKEAHMLLNLPEVAIEFLDALPGCLSTESVIHTGNNTGNNTGNLGDSSLYQGSTGDDGSVGIWYGDATQPQTTDTGRITGGTTGITGGTGGKIRKLFRREKKKSLGQREEQWHTGWSAGQPYETREASTKEHEKLMVQRMDEVDAPNVYKRPIPISKYEADQIAKWKYYYRMESIFYQWQRTKFPVKGNHTFCGFPIHFASTDLSEIRSFVMAAKRFKKIIDIPVDNVAYVVRSRVFPLTGGVVSCWMFLGCEIPWTNRQQRQRKMKRAKGKRKN